MVAADPVLPQCLECESDCVLMREDQMLHCTDCYYAWFEEQQPQQSLNSLGLTGSQLSEQLLTCVKALDADKEEGEITLAWLYSPGKLGEEPKMATLPGIFGQLGPEVTQLVLQQLEPRDVVRFAVAAMLHNCLGFVQLSQRMAFQWQQLGHTAPPTQHEMRQFCQAWVGGPMPEGDDTLQAWRSVAHSLMKGLLAERGRFALQPPLIQDAVKLGGQRGILGLPRTDFFSTCLTASRGLEGQTVPHILKTIPKKRRSTQVDVNMADVVEEADNEANRRRAQELMSATMREGYACLNAALAQHNIVMVDRFASETDLTDYVNNYVLQAELENEAFGPQLAAQRGSPDRPGHLNISVTHPFNADTQGLMLLATTQGLRVCPQSVMAVLREVPSTTAERGRGVRAMAAVPSCSSGSSILPHVTGMMFGSRQAAEAVEALVQAKARDDHGWTAYDDAFFGSLGRYSRGSSGPHRFSQGVVELSSSGRGVDGLEQHGVKWRDRD